MNNNEVDALKFITHQVEDRILIFSEQLSKSKISESRRSEYVSFFNNLSEKLVVINTLSKHLKKEIIDSIFEILDEFKNSMELLINSNQSQNEFLHFNNLQMLQNLFAKLMFFWPHFEELIASFKKIDKSQTKIKSLENEILNLRNEIEQREKKHNTTRTQYEQQIQVLEVKNIQLINELTEEKQKIAHQIEDRAIETALKVSLKPIQDEFDQAKKEQDKKVKFWWFLTLISFAAFIWLAQEFTDMHFNENMQWSIIYFTSVRILILGIFGAAIAFSIKMLRAHIHMRELNLHRQRIANSLQSFVDAAHNSTQKDFILVNLVDIITRFGESGILTREVDSTAQTKIITDSIMRNLTSTNRS